MRIDDRAALEDLLLDVNYEHGETPELVGYDKVGRPVVAWLFDAGDEAPLRAAILGGEDAGHPELIDTDPDALLYPLAVLIPESWAWLCSVCATAPSEFADGVPLWHQAGHPKMDRAGVHPRATP